MASFGAKYPCFAPISAEPDQALPTYDTAHRIEIGKLVKADLTVNLASGEIYANDVLAESVSEFASGTIAMETDDMEDTAATVVYGVTVTNKLLADNVADAAPEGGLAYYKKLMRNGKILYKGFFYPKVKAALGNDSAATKGSSITFSTTATTFTVKACGNGDWRQTEVLETEAAAKAWVKERLGGGTPPATYSITDLAGQTIADSTATVKTYGVAASKKNGIAVGESVTLTATLAENVPVGKKVIITFSDPKGKSVLVAAGSKQASVTLNMPAENVVLAATATEATA